MTEPSEISRNLAELERPFITSVVHAIQQYPESNPDIYIDGLLDLLGRTFDDGRDSVPLRDTNVGSVIIDAADICSRGAVNSRKLSQRCSRI